MGNTVIYVRISQDRQGEALGVQRQEKDCRQLAERLGLTVQHVYVDNDISAYSGKTRPAYQEMLDGIRDDTITHVIAWHTDRLHRNTGELLEYIDLSVAKKLPTLTVTSGPLDLSTPNGRASAITLGAWARAESEHKADRVRAWTKQRAENGHSHGGRRPYGWMPDRIHLDPTEHAVITDMVERLLAGESLRSITVDLVDRQVPTVTSGTWSRQMIRKMLCSPRMVGLRTHQGVVVAKGNWEPALDEPTWQSITALLKDPERRTTTVTSRKNLLAGIARCGECDEPIRTKYNARRHYRCAACGLWRRQEPIDDYVSGFVVGLLETLDDEPEPTIDPAAAQTVAELRQRIRATEKAFSADDEMTPEDLLTVLRPLKARLKKAEAAVVPPRRPALLRGRTGPNAGAAWRVLNLDQRRAMISELVDVRIMRSQQGTGQFDPATVKITRR